MSKILVKDSNSSVYLKRHPHDLKHVNKDITFDKERIQKENITMSCGK